MGSGRGTRPVERCGGREELRSAGDRLSTSAATGIPDCEAERKARGGHYMRASVSDDSYEGFTDALAKYTKSTRDKQANHEHY